MGACSRIHHCFSFLFTVILLVFTGCRTSNYETYPSANEDIPPVNDWDFDEILQTLWERLSINGTPDELGRNIFVMVNSVQNRSSEPIDTELLTKNIASVFSHQEGITTTVFLASGKIEVRSVTRGEDATDFIQNFDQEEDGVTCVKILVLEPVLEPDYTFYGTISLLEPHARDYGWQQPLQFRLWMVYLETGETVWEKEMRILL